MMNCDVHSKISSEDLVDYSLTSRSVYHCFFGVSLFPVEMYLLPIEIYLLPVEMYLLPVQMYLFPVDHDVFLVFVVNEPV